MMHNDAAWIEDDAFQLSPQSSGFTSGVLVWRAAPLCIRSWADTFLISRISTEMLGTDSTDARTLRPVLELATRLTSHYMAVVESHDPSDLHLALKR